MGNGNTNVYKKKKMIKPYFFFKQNLTLDVNIGRIFNFKLNLLKLKVMVVGIIGLKPKNINNQNTL